MGYSFNGITKTITGEGHSPYLKPQYDFPAIGLMPDGTLATGTPQEMIEHHAQFQVTYFLQAQRRFFERLSIVFLDFGDPKDDGSRFQLVESPRLGYRMTASTLTGVTTERHYQFLLIDKNKGVELDTPDLGNYLLYIAPTPVNMRQLSFGLFIYENHG